MASIDPQGVALIPRGGGTPTAALEGGAAGDVACTCPGLAAAGTVIFTGTGGESLAGWALGFVQLKFIATDYARNRGNTAAEGSVVVSRSNQILCRDTDETTPEIWYDPMAWGIHDGRGTRELLAETALPPGGNLVFAAVFRDAPHRHFDVATRNETTHRDNFLHHVDIGLAFCSRAS